MLKPDRAAFSPTLLRSFVAVADAGQFTAAARALGLSQSTVSQHVARLERHAGRRLLSRDTHNTALTADGEAMTLFARRMIETADQAAAFFDGNELRGRIRLGVSEDLAGSRLPEILRGFTAANPLVDLDLLVGLSHALHEHLEAGRVDLIFTKRQPGSEHGRLVWSERLAWIGIAQTALAPDRPVPLVLYSSPESITRRLAIDALQRARRPWRVACSTPSLAAATAAVQAGLGVMAQSTIVLRDGLKVLHHDLPELDEVHFAVTGRATRLHGPAAALAELIGRSGPAMRPGSTAT